MKNRLFVGGLQPTITQSELRTLFSPYGKIQDMYIPVAKGIAFIEFGTEESADKAIRTLDGGDFQKKRLSVSFAREKEVTQRPVTFASRNGSGNSGNRSSFAPRRGGNGGGRGKDGKLALYHESLFVQKAKIREEEEAYVPQHAFSDFALSSAVKENIAKRGYVYPTPIQDQSLPHILEGKDLIGIANTGTGKTASFLLPIIEKILNNQQEKALIIVPTRELATQIQDELRIFAANLRIRSALCIGGASLSNQIQNLATHPQIVIGTPGRLQDLVKQRKLQLGGIHTIVLDEVDRMLDMGFVDAVTALLSLLPKERQSLFFSATVTDDANRLMKTFLHEPVTISVKKGNTSDNVDQDIIRVTDAGRKMEQLHDLLIQQEYKKVLIFGRTKRGVEKIATGLDQRGFKVASLHGDKTQARRQKALKDFKHETVNILVATDLAARGLDIDDITHVINYDLPETYEDYVHRIGRTGRANKTGHALTFIMQ